MSKKFVSGGAKGADTEWAEFVVQRNLPMYVLSFNGTRVEGPGIVKRIDNVQLQTATKYVTQAALSMRKSLPSSEFSRRYLQRDWFIVQQAQMVVAIGYLDPDKIGGLGVVGGTGYGCQMYYERAEREGIPLLLFLFDMGTNRWLLCKPDGTWEDTFPPDLIGCDIERIALIGSRDMTIQGTFAIRDCFC